MLRRRIKPLIYIDFLQISPYLAVITGQNAALMNASHRLKAEVEPTRYNS
jgi:hypothetical protein